MRMRPWLEEQINSNTIPGLKWLNKVSVLGACVCVEVGGSLLRDVRGDGQRVKLCCV